MPENEQARYFNRIFKWLFFITFVVCLPSIAMYFYARLTGSLPSEAAWNKRGGNHGPWWGEPQGTLIEYSLLAMLLLPCITFMFALATSLEMKLRKLKACNQLFALASFQFLVGFVVFFLIFWTVD